MDVQVRLAQPGDLDAVLALYAQLHPGEAPPPPERSRTVFEHTCRRRISR